MRKIQMSEEQKMLREIYSTKMLLPIVIPYALFLWYLIVEMIYRLEAGVFGLWGEFFQFFVPFLSILWIVMRKVVRPESNIRIALKLLWDYWRFLLPIIVIFLFYSFSIGRLGVFVFELLMTAAVSFFFAVLYEIGYRIMHSTLLPLCFLTAYTLNSTVPIADWTEKFSFLNMVLLSQYRIAIVVYAVLALIGYILCQKNIIR